MQGTWSMVFRGRASDVAKLIAGIKNTVDNPCVERFRKPLLKAAVGLNNLSGNRKKVLCVESSWKHAIIGLSDAMKAFHKFAPRTEAACRTMIEEYCYIDYLAPKAEKLCFTEMRRARAKVYEGELGDIEYEEVELMTEGGEKCIWKVEKNYKFVLRMWDTW